jgi:hypothetical protein
LLSLSALCMRRRGRRVVVGRLVLLPGRTMPSGRASVPSGYAVAAVWLSMVVRMVVARSMGGLRIIAGIVCAPTVRCYAAISLVNVLSRW